ncbi:MAG: hypothetical protein ACKODX_14445 [Gemmata sp.]
MNQFTCTVAALLALCTLALAEDNKAKEGPVALKLIAKTDKYKFDGGGKAPDEYRRDLEGLAAKAKKGELVRAPKPPAVDLVLQIVNTSKADVTVQVGGDPNVFTFELTGGAGTVAMGSGLAFTADFRLPTAVTLAPGKSHDIPVKQLSDGSRGAARYVYWAGPGDYQLSATYRLADQNGNPHTTLKSEPVKITVEK